MLLYALRIGELLGPGPVVFDGRGLLVSFAFGIIAAAACLVGATAATQNRSHRQAMLAVYAILFGWACFPAIALAAPVVYVNAMYR